MIIDVQCPLGANLREPGNLNGSWFRRQIARSKALVNKDKSDYYNKLISDNSHDSCKLWRELHKTLNKVFNATLPSHGSEKSLTSPTKSTKCILYQGMH